MISADPAANARPAEAEDAETVKVSVFKHGGRLERRQPPPSRLTALKPGVRLPGSGVGQAPGLRVPANQGAVLTRAVAAHVCPHAEQVELDCARFRSPGRGTPWGPAAQPQGAGGGHGLSDDGPRRRHSPVNLRRPDRG